jgi:anti-sigma factor RsiW
MAGTPQHGAEGTRDTKTEGTKDAQDMDAHCHDIEPLLAGWADEELDARQREAVEEHLSVCASCRASAEVQRGVHDLVAARADRLQTRAPEALRQRVSATVAQHRRQTRWSPLRLPVAATVLLTFLVMGTYSLTSTSNTVLAAQLALDHLKCVKLVDDQGGAGLDPAVAGGEWERTYHWAIAVPEVHAEDGTKLIGVRRCLYGHGHLAHLLYNVNGRVVSLFIMPRADHEAAEQSALLDVFGHQARVWSSGAHTFALVTDADAEGMDRLEGQFRAE